MTDKSPPKISKPWLLVTLLPFHIDDLGGVWIDRLWHKDLLEHLTYIKDLSLLAPKHARLDFRDPVRMSESEARRIKFNALPQAQSLGAALKTLPRTIFQSWSAVGKASIVHSSVIGWPFPIGWIINPIALVRKRFLFIVIESAPWRLTAAKQASWKERLRARITEILASYFVNRANLTLFTHDTYRSSLATKPKGKSIVIPASWIDADDILAKDDKNYAVRPSRLFRFVCASRLTYDKGIGVLLDALRLLDDAKMSCKVTILGSGELQAACNSMARTLSTVRLRVLDPVAYGEPLFRFLRDSDCVVIPIISDEQPRIVFDAYSQGRPIIASDTDGLRPHVANGKTGWLVKAGDPYLLAETMKMVMSKTSLNEFNNAASDKAVELTHKVMHHRRWMVLSDLIER